MKKGLLLILATLFMSSGLVAQSYAFGVKGGFTGGFQKWNNFQTRGLYKYHGIIYIESAPEGNQFAVFGQVGYHVKGSALRPRNGFSFSGNPVQIPTTEFQFRNISLTVGAKQKMNLGSGGSKLYYLMGLRGDYTINTNLDDLQNTVVGVGSTYPYESDSKNPLDRTVNKFNYGVTIGGGLEFGLSDYLSGILEVTVNPDFSLQYQTDPYNARDPYTGDIRNVPERRIKNTTLEISLGLRFLVAIEYVDLIVF